MLRRAGDLWRLLAAMVLHKLHGQVERHTAARRDMRREIDVGADPTEPIAFQDTQPGPDDVAALAEEVRELLESRGTLARRALELRLQGETIEDIASAVGRSQRTVRRLLGAARSDLENRWQTSSRSELP